MATTNTTPKSKGLPDWVIYVILGLLLLVLVYWNYTSFVGSPWSANPKSADCLRTQATITEVSKSGGNTRKSRETYYVTYKYTVDGKEYSVKDQVTATVYNRSNEGSTFEICYMKENPDRSAVIGNDVAGENLIYVFLLDIGALVVIVMLIRAAIKKKKAGA